MARGALYVMMDLMRMMPMSSVVRWDTSKLNISQILLLILIELKLYETVESCQLVFRYQFSLSLADSKGGHQHAPHTNIPTKNNCANGASCEVGVTCDGCYFDHSISDKIYCYNIEWST